MIVMEPSTNATCTWSDGRGLLTCDLERESVVHRSHAPGNSDEPGDAFCGTMACHQFVPAEYRHVWHSGVERGNAAEPEGG
jgi:hypothetical protein